MEVLEQFTAAKNTATPSEDRVAVTVSYAAVIDGATAKHAPSRLPTCSTPTPGARAAAMLAAAVATLPARLTAREAVDRMTAALARPHLLASPNDPNDPNDRKTDKVFNPLDPDRPTAAIVIYSVARREVWQVGDCPCLIGDCEYRNEKAVDHILARRRAAVIRRALATGLSAADVAADDLGRRAIQPYITAQVRLQNALCRHGFGVLDGTHVPDAYIKVYSIPADVREIVLASDGYPRLFPIWEATERHLQSLLAADPLCIGSLQATKGLRPGADSFDDRTYLRISL